MSGWIWAILGLLLILLEFFVPQFVIFFFGVGALLTAAITALVPGFIDRVPAQFLLWATSSLVFTSLLRRYVARWFRGEPADTPTTDEIGRTATVVEAIAPERPGRIRFGGTTWKASSFDEELAVGTDVTIIEKTNLAYVVTGTRLTAE